MALAEVLAALEAGGGKALFSADALGSWGDGSVSVLRKAGLLKPATKARTVECHGCEERCYSEVHVSQGENGRTRAFVVCEVPHKQAEMGRVAVELERLEQWQCSLAALAAFIREALGLPSDQLNATSNGSIRLGMVAGVHGRRWVSLRPAPLVLDIQQQQIPLNECLFADAGGLVLDRARIQALVDRPDVPTSKAYQGATDRRESRRDATAAMQQSWRDAYVRLKQQHPHKPKTWIASKIARMPIAQGRDSETIRKQLR